MQIILKIMKMQIIKYFFQKIEKTFSLQNINKNINKIMTKLKFPFNKKLKINKKTYNHKIKMCRKFKNKAKIQMMTLK